MEYGFAQALLLWYKENRRELPWRGTQDPYRIWVSEVILQQTRVAQGYDYFLRFMEAFPRVEVLAVATEDEVLKCWQGLGYYSRARNLHKAAKQVVASGGFPSTYEGIRALSGVGDYTAAAIASFAFGLRHAVVDGNVYRVLSRYFGVSEAVDTVRGKRYFARLAAELLPEDPHVADYNQAVMDFGAMVCVPKSPACRTCPLAEGCVAASRQVPEAYPVKSRTLAVSERYLHYIYIKAQGEVALFRRDKADIWKGLYEPYLVETEAALTPEQFVAALDGSAFAEASRGVVWTILRSGVRHKLTHRTLVCNFYCLDLDRKPSDAVFGRPAVWVTPEELPRYAVSRLVSMLMEDVALRDGM